MKRAGGVGEVIETDKEERKEEEIGHQWEGIEISEKEGERRRAFREDLQHSISASRRVHCSFAGSTALNQSYFASALSSQPYVNETIRCRAYAAYARRLEQFTCYYMVHGYTATIPKFNNTI